MAGTAELARAVAWAISRGGSVRLVGDDAQPAAVGAGGVLRDLAHTHGAIRLQQVVRFTDPAEAAASLALREGDPSSLGFYLDHQRVHVGDPTTAANQAFAAWHADRTRRPGQPAARRHPRHRHRAEPASPRRPACRRCPRRRRRAGGGADGRHPGQRRRRDPHPPQRPAADHHHHRLGQERRPLHRPARPARRGAPRGPPGHRTARGAAGGVRRRARPARVRQHRPHCAGPHRRHQPHRAHRRRGPAAALRRRHPRPRHQLAVPADRRRRRRARAGPAGQRPATDRR